MAADRGNCRFGLELGIEPCRGCPNQSKCQNQQLACEAYVEYTATGAMFQHFEDRDPTHHIFLKLFPGSYRE